MMRRSGRIRRKNMSVVFVGTTKHRTIMDTSNPIPRNGRG